MTTHPLFRLLSLFLVVAGLAACSGGDSGNPLPAAAAATGAAPDSRYAALARGRVDVQGGLRRVVGPRAGTLLAWKVEVGDTVKAGQVMALMDNRAAELAVAQAQAEIGLLRAQAAAQRAQLPAARTRAARLREASAAGAASGQAADDAQQAVLEIEAQQGVQSATLQAAQQKLAQARYSLELGVVRAPVAGKLIRRDARAGDVVEAGAALAELMPLAPLVVLAELGESAADLVKVGMKAEIVPAASNGPVNAAEVTRVGEVFGPSRNDNPAQPAADIRVLECTLKLLGNDAVHLRVGQQVLVKVLR